MSDLKSFVLMAGKHVLGRYSDTILLKKLDEALAAGDISLEEYDKEAKKLNPRKVYRKGDIIWTRVNLLKLNGGPGMKEKFVPGESRVVQTNQGLQAIKPGEPNVYPDIPVVDPKVQKVPEKQDRPTDGLEVYTIEELKALVAEKAEEGIEISLTGLKTKAEILAAIRNALAEV